MQEILYIYILLIILRKIKIVKNLQYKIYTLNMTLLISWVKAKSAKKRQ